MKIAKFWHFACLVFAFYSLETLVEEHYEVLYEKSDGAEPVEYLACLPLRDFYPNETEIELQQLRIDLFNYFNSSPEFDLWRTEEPSFKELVLDRTKSGGYLILNGVACLIENKEDQQIVRLYLPSNAVYFAIKRESIDFLQMNKNDHIDQLIVLKKEHPYSDCIKSRSRFRCLNECFRSRFRLARYYYDSNETGLIQLNYSDKNQTILESEKNCFRQCKRESCYMAQLISVDQNAFRKVAKTTKFQARPRLKEFDYYIQAIGLLCCFTGLCFNDLSSIAFDYIQSKVTRKALKIALFGLKLVVLCLSLAACGYLCARMALDHEESDLPAKDMTRSLVRPKVIYLAICVFASNNLRKKFINLTMYQLEKETEDQLNNSLEGINVTYRSKSYRTDYRVHSRVLFMYYQRCFVLSIPLHYPIAPSAPKLKIKWKSLTQLYILSENEILNEKSFRYYDRFAFQKTVVSRSKSDGKCIDYVEKFVNCTSRSNCVERCISRKFLKEYHKIPLTNFGRSLHVVDRDWFSSTEWNTSKPTLLSSSSHRKMYEGLKKQCLHEIQDVACLETEFEETGRILESDADLQFRMEIDLQFDVVRLIKESPSSYRLSLDLVNILGITVLSSLQMIGSRIQSTLNGNKAVPFLLYLLCSLGGAWHTYQIFDQLVNEGLTPTRYYELVKRVQVPVMAFCSDIDEQGIDENHALTGNYLEELTRNVTAERFFKSITYLNESNEWIPFDLARVRPFFLRNMKCFRMKIDQEYDRDQFQFSTKKQVIKVNFSDTRNDWKSLVHFFTITDETAEFSKIINLHYFDYLSNLEYQIRYSAVYETSLYQYEDRYSFIRRHFVSFREEDSGDLLLPEMLRNEYDFRSLSVPVEQTSFGLELDEDLFEQLCWAQHQKNRDKQTNYQQVFVANHPRRDEQLDSDFSLNLDFLQMIVLSTNAETLGKLILSLLNVLFTWFDLGLLDLHLLLFQLSLYAHLFVKVNRILLANSKRLKKLKLSLCKLLKPPIHKDPRGEFKLADFKELKSIFNSF